MNIQNGAHSPKKKSKGGFISNTFIISKNDTPQRKTGKIMAIISLVLIIAAVVLGSTIIWRYVDTNNQNVDIHNKLVPTNDSSVGESRTDGNNVSSVPDEFDDKGILKELSQWYKLNPDTIGHIYIPDTKLDYPVVKRPNDDVKEINGDFYYLTHTLDKKYNAYGTPFADYKATFANGYQSANVTIYGHNSKVGEFFESVKYYKDINFYKEHPIVNFDTIYGKGQYKIIGIFTEHVTSNSFFKYHEYYAFNPNPKDSEQNDLAKKVHNEFVTEVDKRNYYESGVDIKFGDNFLTLSTCNDEIQGAKDTPYRDVLVARKVRPGENVTVDVSKIKENTDVIMPEGWIKKFGKENPYK